MMRDNLDFCKICKYKDNSNYDICKECFGDYKNFEPSIQLIASLNRKNYKLIKENSKYPIILFIHEEIDFNKIIDSLDKENIKSLNLLYMDKQILYDYINKSNEKDLSNCIYNVILLKYYDDIYDILNYNNDIINYCPIYVIHPIIDNSKNKKSIIKIETNDIIYPIEYDNVSYFNTNKFKYLLDK